MVFKIDTGAEVTVIPASSYNPVKDGPLHSPTRKLYGQSQQKLKVKGQFTGNLKKGDTEVRQEMYVVQGLRQPLVGCPTIAALNLVTRIESVTSENHRVVDLFPKVFQGLGRMEGEFKIKKIIQNHFH